MWSAHISFLFWDILLRYSRYSSEVYNYNGYFIQLQVIELPLINPELFQRVGITPPKGCLLYGPPGTGKTLLARAVASQLDANFLKVVSSAIVDKYIGESARLIREMFSKCYISNDGI